MTDKIKQLYSKAFPSKRSGNLYSAFSYPTKISPEVIAVFIASHTKPGDVVLDTFGGSGTTGLAALLCANPTDEVINLAKKMNAPAIWGPRHAFIYEISTLGAFISNTMCNPPDPDVFLTEAEKLIDSVQKKLGWMYSAIDPDGNEGVLRHAIWSEILECNSCGYKVSYWDSAVKFNPLSLASNFTCEKCGYQANYSDVKRVTEEYYDRLLNKKIIRKKRVIKRIYGETGNKKWVRDVNEQDNLLLSRIEEEQYSSYVPIEEIKWGDLYRSGYHTGITHAHHFYTKRNLHVLSALWELVNESPKEVRDALKLLILSYNSSHSTLMTRVVVKNNEKDFVVTGAQSGVLYISNLPVEKNIITGLKRKLKTIYKAFLTIYKSDSTVKVINGSSTKMDELSDESVNYVFTDPPFGDYIPYSELNFLNEVWLGKKTNTEQEAIISNSQKKTVNDYQHLMEQVFKEISRVLTPDGKVTVVFHSAKAEVWKALQASYQKAGLSVKLSSVLDKLQGSFKQVTSNITVKGDPLLLLEKNRDRSIQLSFHFNIEEIIGMLILQMKNNGEEITKERIFSRFVNYCLEKNLEVPMDASEFYRIVCRKV